MFYLKEPVDNIAPLDKDATVAPDSPNEQKFKSELVLRRSRTLVIPPTLANQTRERGLGAESLFCDTEVDGPEFFVTCARLGTAGVHSYQLWRSRFLQELLQMGAAQ